MVVNLVSHNANTHNSQEPEEEEITKMFLMSNLHYNNKIKTPQRVNLFYSLPV